MRQGEMNKIGVIGAGSWGTTLANFLAGKGCVVDLWVREEEVYEQIKQDRINRAFLPDIPLEPSLNPVKTFHEALEGKELILLVVPSHVFREVLTRLKSHLRPGMSLMAATKGIENKTLETMSQVAQEILPETFTSQFAGLAGPSFAREVCSRQPTAVTIGCRDIAHAETLQKTFYRDFFRVYVTQDILGIELCGALKNVIAIAAGAADGLRFGHNARAALITRGLAEMTRLGVAMGANPYTFAGLAGMGDLVLTCTGDLSRNRTVGLKIGQGMKLAEIVNSMNMVAEGVKTTQSAYYLGRKMKVDMPITEQIYQTLYEGKDPREAVKELMTRGLKFELEN